MSESAITVRTPTGGWRVYVEHRTVLRYEGGVRSSYNEARITPCTNLTQTTLDSSVEVSPSVTTSRYTDYWGSNVTVFDVPDLHEELVVTGRSVVETAAIAPEPKDAAWSALSDPATRDRYIELLTPTTRTALDSELGVIAAELSSSRSPLRTAYAIAEWVQENVTYVPGATGVQTSALEAYRQRAGVCQDIAHLALGMLRSLGVPARYVSGYLHPVDEAPVGMATEGQSHAWVEWWTGEWYAFDPTNGIAADRRHVVVAKGRDYGDVTPLKGIFRGAGARGLDVSVTVTRRA